MNVPRETIYAALFNYLSTGIGITFLTKSRRVRLWTDVPAEEQPAFFLQETGEDQLEGRRGIPYKWELTADAVIYVNVGADPTLIPGSFLNPILDTFEHALNPRPSWQQIGLPGISEVRIFGKTVIRDGDLGPQGIALIPLRIVTA